MSSAVTVRRRHIRRAKNEELAGNGRLFAPFLLVRRLVRRLVYRPLLMFFIVALAAARC
jgi:hypothetical protein